MIHIRKKDSSFDPNIAYSVVVTSNWNEPLEQHPTMVLEPDVFEIADCDIPSHAQYMTYTDLL
ncbi:hypothetical protein UFOVP215_21 [uncultured Caudovirales phage]|uniref:Uncharacterized protein n=1 Tax=uncultured Caudovirales phage TaxID=2100421 RepID=A0A6J7WRX4_9CAUD|nr:hypothetical protein UFOVP215_21 [uncultured Caudovirales phage]